MLVNIKMLVNFKNILTSEINQHIIETYQQLILQKRKKEASKMKTKKEKKTVIVATGRRLTKEEIQNFERDNPGYRLCFRLRHPDFPLWFSIGSLIASIMILLLSIIMPLVKFL